MINYEEVLGVLRKSWSIKTSSKYTEENPALGQCPVTSIVVQRKFGGDILKTKADSAWHFYNKINGEIYDFTKEQFVDEIQYLNLESLKEEALAYCTLEQIKDMRKSFTDALNKILKKKKWV